MQVYVEKNRADSLIDTGDTIDERLMQMDVTDPQDRSIALGAIQHLVEKFIQPAMVDCPLSSSAFDTFDIEAITKTEFRGLVRNLFNQRMNGLEKPSDEKLKALLEEFDMPLSDVKQRDQFYRCWAAERANASINSLISFLKKPLTEPITPHIDNSADEVTFIEKLLRNTLPGDLRYSLESLINWIKQA